MRLSAAPGSVKRLAGSGNTAVVRPTDIGDEDFPFLRELVPIDSNWPSSYAFRPEVMATSAFPSSSTANAGNLPQPGLANPSTLAGTFQLSSRPSSSPPHLNAPRPAPGERLGYALNSGGPIRNIYSLPQEVMMLRPAGAPSVPSRSHNPYECHRQPYSPMCVPRLQLSRPIPASSAMVVSETASLLSVSPWPWNSSWPPLQQQQPSLLQQRRAGFNALAHTAARGESARNGVQQPTPQVESLEDLLINEQLFAEISAAPWPYTTTSCLSPQERATCDSYRSYNAGGNDNTALYTGNGNCSRPDSVATPAVPALLSATTASTGTTAPGMATSGADTAGCASAPSQPLPPLLSFGPSGQHDNQELRSPFARLAANGLTSLPVPPYPASGWLPGFAGSTSAAGGGDVSGSGDRVPVANFGAIEPVAAGATVASVTPAVPASTWAAARSSYTPCVTQPSLPSTPPPPPPLSPLLQPLQPRYSAQELEFPDDVFAPVVAEADVTVRNLAPSSAAAAAAAAAGTPAFAGNGKALMAADEAVDRFLAIDEDGDDDDAAMVAAAEENKYGDEERRGNEEQDETDEGGKFKGVAGAKPAAFGLGAATGNAAIGSNGRSNSIRAKRNAELFERLREAFDLSASEAAHSLGVSATELKRRCRTVGIERWPQRKLSSLRRIEAAVATDAAVSEEERQFIRESVARNREDILVNPNAPLLPHLKTLRQVQYKQSHDRRVGSGRKN